MLETFGQRLVVKKQEFCGFTTCEQNNKEIDWSLFSALIDSFAVDGAQKINYLTNSDVPVLGQRTFEKSTERVLIFLHPRYLTGGFGERNCSETTDSPTLKKKKKEERNKKPVSFCVRATWT